MPKARLIFHQYRVDASGGIMEIKVWQVPRPVSASAHMFKYSLFYGRAGERLIGFDNERGKGDHMHIGRKEAPYVFVGLDQLLDDFFAAVRKAGGEV